MDKDEAAKAVLGQDIEEICARVIEKISKQWPTIRKAFSAINTGSNGKISYEELDTMLNFWQIIPDKYAMRQVFDRIDADKDGFISYPDFV